MHWEMASFPIYHLPLSRDVILTHNLCSLELRKWFWVWEYSKISRLYRLTTLRSIRLHRLFSTFLSMSPPIAAPLPSFWWYHPTGGLVNKIRLLSGTVILNMLWAQAARVLLTSHGSHKKSPSSQEWLLSPSTQEASIIWSAFGIFCSAHNVDSKHVLSFA